ncbi:MAG: hypothetical protein ABEJ58_08405 [Halodesulfurarchaeum sp.]
MKPRTVLRLWFLLSVAVWILLSVLAIVGLAVYHAYVEDRAVSDAAKDVLIGYGEDVKWWFLRGIEERGILP